MLVKIMRWLATAVGVLFGEKTCLRSCREKDPFAHSSLFLLFLFDLLAGIHSSLPPRDFHSSKKGKQKSGRGQGGRNQICPSLQSLPWFLAQTEDEVAEGNDRADMRASNNHMLG